jgi:hypothetical protein
VLPRARLSRPAIAFTTARTAADSVDMRDDTSATAFYERYQDRLLR